MKIIEHKNIRKAADVIVGVLIAAGGMNVSIATIDHALNQTGLNSNLKFYAAKADPRLSIIVNDNIATIILT